MTLEKAIEILSDIIVYEHSVSKSDKGTAIRLGIQAMRECIQARRGDPALDGELLADESEGEQIETG